ncbi:endo-1,4-beta-xylanase [Butyrivibrio sp. INlla14]|nr:endo-1,4-beta-xylanase [Butyrivibrio sp. INlla14]
MHKKWLGLSSLVMAGMLSVTSVGAGVTTVYATEPGELSVVEEQQEAVAEASAEASSEEAATAGSSEEEVIDESATAGSSDETKEEEEPGTDAPVIEEPEIEEADKNNLVFHDRWNSSVTSSGKLTFTKQYQEFVYDLGNTFDSANVKGVTVKVSNQQNNVCIKFYDADMNEKQANYGCNGNSQYTMVPTYDGTVRYIGVMSMPSGEENYPYGITIDDVVVEATSEPAHTNEKVLVFEGDNLVFEKAWQEGEPVVVKDGVLTFEKEWDQFNLSLGEKVPGENIKALKITFEEANSQSVCFKTYSEGEELTADYGKKGSKEYATYPSATKDVDAIAIMAMNEQTYPFSVKVEKVEVVVDTTPAEEKPEAGVEYDIVDLRDPVEALMGEDFIIGTAVSYDEFRDPNDLALTTKHFNGVTLGNELKPDAMLKKGAEIVDMELNGEMVPFPKLDFSTPEGRLDYFLDWNNEHPDKKIRIRGHVLVWHSQTPDFFFHEDYDTSKPYVTPEVMNKRLEIYIREVAQHFTGEGSKYAGMFYGWDVVNEAVSDGTGTYRNANENSTWWRVYQSPEFINNAFVYANKYMPAEIALFYNDYNDTSSNKVNGICQLISNVKATPGARIDGMGMQGHYQIANNDPSMDAFKAAAHRYAELVDQVQVTELDFKGSANSTDERLAQRYKAVYDTIRRLRNEGVNFTGMTIWGVTDKHSWLQTSNSVGGGANGRVRQYPLLFDDYYKAKNAFWALVDAGELEPEIQTITLVQNANGDFSAGHGYDLTMEDSDALFVPMWSEDGIDVKVTVTDATIDENDKVVIFTDDGAIKVTAVSRSEATATEKGYETIVNVPVDMSVLEANKVKIDFRFQDGDKVMAFNDTTYKQYETSKYYAETVIKPLVAVKKGTVVVDGDISDAAWATAKEIPVAINNGAKASATAKVLWDEENLYVLTTVKDSVLNKAASDAWEQDSVEVFIDENNNKSSAYQDDDKQYRINYENAYSFNGTKCVAENVNSAAVVTEEGYVIEAAFKWTDIMAHVGAQVGFDIQVNDADAAGRRLGYLNWADKSGNGWSSPAVFGTIVLADGEEPDPGVEPEKQATLVTKWGATYYVTEDGEKLTGFQTIDGVTYFFNARGVMQKQTFVTVDGAKYYAKADGSIAKNEVVKKWTQTYIFGEDGAVFTGFFEFEGSNYYAKADGRLVISDWITDGDNKYYAKADGKLAKNETITKWGKKYTFDENCVLVK